MAVGMHSPEMSHIYENVQKKGRGCLADGETCGGRNFTGKNRSKPELFVRLCDGLSSTLLDQLKEALGRPMQKKSATERN